MGSLLRPDPERRDMIGTPDAPDNGEPEERTPFEFVERPRVEPEVYISRPHLGRDPAQSPADSGLDEPAVWPCLKATRKSPRPSSSSSVRASKPTSTSSDRSSVEIPPSSRLTA